MTIRPLILGSLIVAACACNRRDKIVPHPRAHSEPQALAAYIFNVVPPISHPLDIRFDDQVTLLGYDIEPNGAVPRSREVELTLYWTLTGELTGKWKLLTHVLDPFGAKVADLYNAGPLRAGKRGHPRFPPSKWSVGRIYADKLSFSLPPRLAARQVRVVAGVYSTRELSMAVTKGAADEEGRALVATLDVAVENPGITLEKLGPNVRIDIDGRLSEAAWEHTPILGPFLDVAYGEPPRAKAPAQGQARMLWNSQGLFVGYEVRDEDVLGAVARDGRATELWKGDAVVLVVDPDGDGEGDYEVQINPREVVVSSQPAAPKEVGREAAEGARKAWSLRANTAVTVDGTLDQGGDRDTGYVVEALIPWRSFERTPRRQPQAGDAWKMNLYAFDNGAGVAWSPTFAKDDFRNAKRFGTVLFGASRP